MKRFIYAILIIGSVSAFGQNTGIKGGLNIGKEKAEGSGTSVVSDGSLAFMVGLYTESEISEQFRFAPELIFSVDGGKFSFGGNTATDKLSYISAPVLFKFYPNETFNLHAGPQLGFCVAAKGKINGTTQDIKDSVKDINLSMAFGAEVSLQTLSLGLRYVAGLVDISEDDSDIKLNTLQIYLAVPF